MAQGIVRRVPDDVKERLKERAKRHGTQSGSRVRAVIEEATKAEEVDAAEEARVGFGTLMRQRFAKSGLTDEEARLFNEAVEQLRRGSTGRSCTAAITIRELESLARPPRLFRAASV
jgi:plasmid stability protein